ncbi:MAG TPA: tetratricopeptide repeat protein [Candidatus Angelobacter sp.]|nr:tetratricopeptide repeat protein [Candidatus Angelobacter sp.]
MKRNAIVFALATLLCTAGFLPARSQTVGAPTEGKVTQEGKPLPNVQVVLTNVDTGKVNKTKADKSGAFVLLGVPYGNYQVEVIGEKGEKLFTEKTGLGTGDTSASNILNINIPAGGVAPDNKFGLSDPATPKLTKEQLAKIKADNDKIAGLNSLINEAQSARQAQDWPKAENALKQLIAAAPETSRWDFYMALGDAQTHANKFEDAAQTFSKGVQIAQSIVSGSTPPDPKNPNSSPVAAKSGAVRMLTSQGNAYLKLQKLDEAIASLKKAADLEPSSAIGQYNLCGVEFNAQKFDEAKVACNKFIQLEPSGPHTDEVKAFLTQMGK